MSQRPKSDFKDDVCYTIWNLRRWMLSARHAGALLILHFDGVEVLRYELDEAGFWKEDWWVMSAREACKLARERGYYVYRAWDGDTWHHPTKRIVDTWSALKPSCERVPVTDSDPAGSDKETV